MHDLHSCFGVKHMNYDKLFENCFQEAMLNGQVKVPYGLAESNKLRPEYGAWNWVLAKSWRVLGMENNCPWHSVLQYKNCQ